MHSFSAGAHTFQINLTLGELRRVRAAGWDLLALDAGDPPLALRLRSDPYTTGEILWALLAPQLEHANLSETDFVGLLDGPALAAAYQALTEELVDFFQKLGRTDLAELLHTSGRIWAQALVTATSTLERTEIPGTPSPSSPPALNSSPGPGPSANSPQPPTDAAATNGRTPPPSPPSSPPPSPATPTRTPGTGIPGRTNGPTPR